MAAATWIIIEPPWNVDEPEEGAPLGRWKQVAPKDAPTFTSKAACERHLRHKIEDARNAAVVVWCETGQGPVRHQIGEMKDTCARCIDVQELKKAKAALTKPADSN